MINLKDIKEDIQNISEAMVAVLGIDVTIVDENLVRIAGTGTYIDKIGEEVNRYSAFKKSLIDQEAIIIEDPKEDAICSECYNKYNCIEFAEICCPIIYEKKSYGVIGLIAFTKDQAHLIENNKSSYINFIKKMADLISNKLDAQIKTYELELEKKKLETLLNSMEKAIVSVDVDGNIERYNHKFKNIFNVKKDIIGQNVFKILGLNPENAYQPIKEDMSYSFHYNKNKTNLKGIYTVSKITLNNTLKGYVIDFIENKDAIRNYNKITKGYEITLENIIGKTEIIEEIKREALVAAKTTSTVLITGESGTGKELFARAIHNHSKRVENSFIAINCAAIPDNLLESELFGYEEGAFTGAIKGGKLGKFELANNGTIFLDEIGDMSLHLQSKLLRVLQEKELNKIGSRSDVYIDVRVIAATNKNLEQMVREGGFREDLYYRLNVIPLQLPSLKERKDDIPLLVDYMIKEYSNKLEKNVYHIEDKAMQIMCNYDWPGNIRELQNIIEYSINMSSEDIISVNLLPLKIKNNKIKELNKQEDFYEINTIEELEKNEIIKALDKYKDYKKEKELVAKALGISKATLYRKLEKYKII